MVLVRQYAIRYIKKHELKEILKYFQCDFTQKETVEAFVETLDYNDENDQIKNRNIQVLMQLFYTNNELYNTPIHKINWE